ncbi:MAG TPA: hypothetical protein VGG28_18970 [Kofleriaceae bacterium]
MRTFAEAIAPYPDAVRTLATQTRTALRKLLPDCVETIDNAGPYIGFGYTHGYKGMVGTIIVSKAGVKLGLAGAAALPDPDELLEGRGKVHRYVVVSSAATLRQRAVIALVRAADEQARSRVV